MRGLVMEFLCHPSRQLWMGAVQGNCKKRITLSFKLVKLAPLKSVARFHQNALRNGHMKSWWDPSYELRLFHISSKRTTPALWIFFLYSSISFMATVGRCQRSYMHTYILFELWSPLVDVFCVHPCVVLWHYFDMKELAAWSLRRCFSNWAVS